MKKLSYDAIEKQLLGYPDWEYRDDCLTTLFEFENFKDAFGAMTRIAFECEAHNHHPDWSNSYNKLSITLTTHDAGGVTQKDLDLMVAIEQIVEEEE